MSHYIDIGTQCYFVKT